MEIKDRIKLIRREKKITQVEFGEIIGVKGNTVTNYETGLRTPTDAVIKSICREFNVNEVWLRTGKGEMFEELDPEDELMSWAGTVLRDKPDSFRKRFIRMLSKMTDEEWEWVESKLLELFNDTEKGG